MKILYFDCFSGISGDMTIGALIDLGADIQLLDSELKKLDIQDEYSLKVDKTIKKGIAATKFDVLPAIINSDQYRHQQPAQCKVHHHRHYSDIVKMIKKANYNENIESMALAIFQKIGQAEAKIHNIPIEKVHFHEVGAIDSIIDIVGLCILIDYLKVTKIVSSAIPVGNGIIKIAHGNYPVPAPATLEILKGVPLKETELEGELTTPTGAGIVSSLAEKFCSFPPMKVESIGYGAGTKDFPEHSNVLRIILGSF
ncbi:nickel pincer cofactor biosynthesis protein LarC [Bacillaceae bacterium Marseille-Q3522]|nr:nickel pincer cofactor biosynthesis protein LarC [Bacillaceae bacterium Marseille-Q3522]